MASMTKIANEELLIGRDWTLDLDGASIVEAIEPAIVRGTGLECELAGEPEDGITSYWLRGGTRGGTCKVLLSIRTSEDEVLSDHLTVVVH